MKFMFVVGGSYKGFYINELKKINKIDLLIFNQGIFYDFDYEQEYLGDAPVSKELISLNQKLKCPIVVYGRSKFLNDNQKCFIICVNERISIINENKDVYLYIKGKFILIGNRFYKKSKAFATISIMENVRNYREFSVNKNYFICDKRGVTRLQNGMMYRKFRKYCYFILNFHKKML